MMFFGNFFLSNFFWLFALDLKSSQKITQSISIPTIGIGSSKFCDGQILVLDDLIGLSGFYPKFVKKYVNLKKIIESAVSKFKNDVKKGNFPKKANSF